MTSSPLANTPASWTVILHNPRRVCLCYYCDVIMLLPASSSSPSSSLSQIPQRRCRCSDRLLMYEASGDIIIAMVVRWYMIMMMAAAAAAVISFFDGNDNNSNTPSGALTLRSKPHGWFISWSGLSLLRCRLQDFTEGERDQIRGVRFWVVSTAEQQQLLLPLVVAFYFCGWFLFVLSVI